MSSINGWTSYLKLMTHQANLLIHVAGNVLSWTWPVEQCQQCTMSILSFMMTSGYDGSSVEWGLVSLTHLLQPTACTMEFTFVCLAKASDVLVFNCSWRCWWIFTVALIGTSGGAFIIFFIFPQEKVPSKFTCSSTGGTGLLHCEYPLHCRQFCQLIF